MIWLNQNLKRLGTDFNAAAKSKKVIAGATDGGDAVDV